MSCMMLSHNHINFVVNVLAHKHEYTWAEQSMVRASDLDKLGNNLLALNAKAYNGRYPDLHSIKPTKYRYVPLMKANDVDAYKALSCLYYQLCEDATENDPMTKALGRATDALAHQIVSNLAAYQAAPWGIE